MHGLIGEEAVALAGLWAGKLIAALLLLLAGWTVAGWLAGRATGGLDRAHVEPTLGRFISGIVRWTIIVTTAMTALGMVGVHTTSLAALLGAAGVALALALQGTLSSFAAGVLLIVFRPFRVGDTIKVGLHQGRVDSIDLFTTAIDTSDNRRVIVPNSAVFGQTIENLTFHGRRVVELVVPVPVTVSVERAHLALEEAARGLEGAFREPPPEVAAFELQANATLFRVRVWTATDRLVPVSDVAARAVRAALDELLRPPNPS